MTAELRSDLTRTYLNLGAGELVAALVFTVIAAAVVSPRLEHRSDAALGLSAVWLFGVLEYVNYFVVRLSYPMGRWFATVGEWRTPRLIQD